MKDKVSGWLYTDYLEIDQQFVDVYTEEVDRQHARAWQSYIPEANTRALLERIWGILERRSPKPPFIYGPYGTGKTFTAFLIKHLLEDALDEIEPFFAKYSAIKDLWPRWRALRERGPYVVAYRSAATDASSPFRLVYIVQERIAQALKEKGYSATTTETIRSAVLRKLTNSESTFIWPRAFEKHRHRFKEFTKPEEVIARLTETGTEGETLGLLDRVRRTLEDEDIVVLRSAQELKSWIKEVIVQNGLQGLLFLWDEFTDFFKIPGAPVDLVQELAHAAEDTHFYFGLITHLAPDTILKVDEASRRKFLDRFHRHHLELAEVTAYRLMSAVLQVKTERKAEWERKHETLWNEVGRASSLVIMLQGETKEDLRNVVPIHPCTALTLANIARLFSSSQRTLFRFLREERPDRFCFPRFLREYPRDGWRWLTADHLWDYFYADDDPEYPEEIRRFIRHYRANVEKITDEVECRVYKLVLLFDLLHRRLPVSEESQFSFKPTRSRVQRVFEGVLDGERAVAALNSLCKQHLLQRYRVGQNEVYVLPLFAVDDRKIREIKDRIKQTNPFRSLTKTNGEFGRLIADSFQVNPPLGLRHQMCTVAADEFLGRRERVLPPESLKPYQVGIVMVLPFGEGEVATARETARRLSSETPRVIYAVAGKEFAESRWERWVEQRALAEHARERGESEGERSYREMAKILVEEWVRDVVSHGFQMYFRGEVDFVATKEGYEEYLEEAVEKLYPLRPERIFPRETLYTGSAGKQAAEIGLGLVQNPQAPFGEAVDKLRGDGLWDNKDWPQEHPLAGMRAELRNMLRNREEINLLKAWEMLMGVPYGLIPSRIGIMLFGFLLREYTEGYYYWDGNRCEGLNASTLASLIDNVVKQKRGAEDYAIRRMLPAEEEACRLLREIFDLSFEEARYLRTALVRLREHFRLLGYPLWSLSYAG
ncbi:hypothetical protein [Candidatus Desulforudis audaxviator]|uniref:hypothetical protein n=1 Tax=Candidatus Desulforudis audaxviator TaxID=471827 RepID=UPI00140FBCA3|nr:hypothetical protein [Candidatus Desulforudis audaxviator]